MFILLLFCYWPLVLASKGNHQTNIYKTSVFVNIGLVMAF